MTDLRNQSYSILRDTLRWRVAMVLCLLIVGLMVVLGGINTRLGLADTAWLAWLVLAFCLLCAAMLAALPRRQGGSVFFVMIVVILVLVPAYGLAYDRPMQHWAYILPPAIIFLLRANPALLAMLLYGAYATAITTQLLAPIEVIRFSAGYGLLVCFMYTYALLQERAAAMLRYHSDHDVLSNCLNRRIFNEALERIERAGQDCAFLLIDIDHFKSINDTHGHLVGDRVITEVAARLGRELDETTPLYRYGGEEFAVLLRGRTLEEAAALAERLRAGIAGEPIGGLTLSVSIGVSHRRGDGAAAVAQALARADTALYDAKRGGRNQVVAAAIRAGA